MILIASAAYVNTEFQIEFGQLPPSFLPIGNRRLFEYQISLLKKARPNEKITISLPSDYELATKDVTYLNSNGVSIIRGDPNWSLGRSLDFAIENCARAKESLLLIHGDTLVGKIPDDCDYIGIASTEQYYPWEIESISNDGEDIWCGVFEFSHPLELAECVRESDFQFVAGVRKYFGLFGNKFVTIEGWCDFGHINTYFESRSKLTTERAFNRLEVSEGVLRKSGVPPEKILAELQWYNRVPKSLQIYLPKIIDSGFLAGKMAYYCLEYLPMPPLNEVFVHGNNPVFYWAKIFKIISKYIGQARQAISELDASEIRVGDFKSLVVDKTNARIAHFISSSDILTLDTEFILNGEPVPSIADILEDVTSHIDFQRSFSGVLHGDLCFSNILFDSRSSRIKLVDPRGINARGDYVVVGDIRYDLAKLMHSVVGLYDFIIAGAYELNFDKANHQIEFCFRVFEHANLNQIQEAMYSSGIFWGVATKEILGIVVLLFFSMLPLHNDNERRQLALFANALRLYLMFTKA